MDQLLIDGDTLAYNAAFAAEKTSYTVVDAEDPTKVLLQCDYYADAKKFMESHPTETLVSPKKTIGEVSHALSNAKLSMVALLERFRTTEYQVYITESESNYRLKLATIQKYKGNRDKVAKPVYLKEVRSYLQNRWGAELVVDREADDAIGCAQNDKTIICAMDKDMLCIAGRHFRLHKPDDGVMVVSQEDANKNFFKQVLTGDPSDNIPGIYRVGEKTAEKALQGITDPKIMQSVVLAMYEMDERNVNEDGAEARARARMLEVGQLVWIQREKDVLWNFDYFNNRSY